jgi:hypothetical protein
MLSTARYFKNIDILSKAMRPAFPPTCSTPACGVLKTLYLIAAWSLIGESSGTYGVFDRGINDTVVPKLRVQSISAGKWSAQILDKHHGDPHNFRVACNFCQHSLRVRAWVKSSTRFASTAEDKMCDDRVSNA